MMRVSYASKLRNLNRENPLNNSINNNVDILIIYQNMQLLDNLILPSFWVGNNFGGFIA